MMGTLSSLAFGTGPAASAPHADSSVVVVGGADVESAPLDTLVISVAAAAPSATRSTTKPADLQQILAKASLLAADGIPSTALQAYQQAATREAADDPSCGIPWPLLAGIGRVESDHGRADGAVLYSDGESRPHIIGIALDGHGTALIHDSDGGELDHDKNYDHAVGPMQFIPTTWKSYGVDVHAHSVPDPFNIFDAAATAAKYLCAAGGKLTTAAGQVRALHAYNDSDAYVRLVLATEALYAQGTGVVVPTVPADALPATKSAAVPPADPGSPPGLGPVQPVAPAPSGSASVPPSPRVTTSQAPVAIPPQSDPPAAPATTSVAATSTAPPATDSTAPAGTPTDTTAPSSNTAPPSPAGS